ncbi:MAG: YafY family transcriptional regulator [Mycobacteriaceae bacterium]|nr:YafY family transcriptional regulator [Mycobacteriaceae bacterium]
MADTSFRMLRLLSLLQTHRHWPGGALADKLGVSVRTLRRDIDRLREFGYPVRAGRGVDGGYQLAPGAAMPPLVIDDDEAVAIAVGMQAAAQGAVPGIEEPAVRALTKVVQVMPPRLRKRMDALRAATAPTTFAGPQAPPLDPEVLIAAAQACRDCERVSFGYTAHAGRRSDRLAEPHRLVPLGRRWYLVAYDLARHDWRIFRLDRVTGIRRTGASFAPRPLPVEDAAEFVRFGILNVRAAFDVEVVLHAAAARIRPRVGRWASIAELAEDTCLLRMSTDKLDDAAAILGSLGVDFDVRTPPELATVITEWSTRFTRATRTTHELR